MCGCSLSFHFYQQISFAILDRITPLSHSVANCVKRVVVILASIIFLNKKIERLNAVGIGIAFIGVVSYSLLSARK